MCKLLPAGLLKGLWVQRGGLGWGGLLALWPRRSGGRSLLNIPRTLNISPLGNRSPVADTDQRKLHKRGRRGAAVGNQGHVRLILCARVRRSRLLEEHMIPLHNSFSKTDGVI